MTAFRSHVVSEIVVALVGIATVIGPAASAAAQPVTLVDEQVIRPVADTDGVVPSTWGAKLSPDGTTLVYFVEPRAELPARPVSGTRVELPLKFHDVHDALGDKVAYVKKIDGEPHLRVATVKWELPGSAARPGRETHEA